MKTRRALPPEEAFDSLAARVRPVLIRTESVYYEKVLHAIQADIDASAQQIPDDLLVGLAGLRQAWSTFDVDGTTTMRFAVQSAAADRSETSPPVSDTQLAAAWLYGDLVHADTRGKKRLSRHECG